MSTATVTPYVLTDGGCTVDSREQEAFDTYVRARLPELLRFGRSLTGSEHAAADLVQDALERALLHWRRIESHEDPEGYIRRIMVNRNISLWRKFGRERPTEQIPDDGQHDPAPHDPTAPVWQALRRLPPRQRAVVALRYYDDLSEAQIADLLGCSVGTVKSQASKAMTKLRRLLPQLDDPGSADDPHSARSSRQVHGGRHG